MVYQKRTQARWTVKAPAESNTTYDKELTKPGMRRSNSGDTDLSDSGKFSSSSGDESWSGMSDNASVPGTPPASNDSSQAHRTKLSGESKLFVPKQPVQTTEQRTRLSSGASVFVPGQQMMQTYTPQAEMFCQMMPMDQSVGYMPCYYMAADGSAAWGMCPVAVPVMSGAAPFVPDEAMPEPARKPRTPKKELVVVKKEPVKPVKDPAFTAAKFVPTESSKSRWADLDEEDDEYEDPWLKT